MVNSQNRFLKAETFVPCGTNDKIDTNSLLSYRILNFNLITKGSEIIGVRGQTLSAPKKRWLLKKIKSAGIDTIIDLRAGDHSGSFIDACQDAGLKYFHFPVDRFRTPNAVIINNLPAFIETINNGGFYISCALGLHRTDIALSLYYILNPEAQKPPILYGHIRDGKLQYADIFQRAGSIYHSLTEADKNRLGWDESFVQEFVRRKKMLLKQQEIYFNGL